MTDAAANIIGVAFFSSIFAFVLGHMVGYWRGKGRVTCPLCEGRGSVPAKGPTINNEKEVFEAGFSAGLREGKPGYQHEEEK